MVQISSSELKVVFNNFLAIENILSYTTSEAVRRTKSSPDFLYTIKFPFIGDDTKKKNKEDALLSKFKELSQIHRDNTILIIVAEFERLVFEKIKSSSVLIKDVVENGYVVGQPMHDFKVSFIKEEEDIFNLKGFNSFLTSHPNHKAELQEIIDFRNYLAHGKRIKVGKPSNMTLEQIVTKLDSILYLL